MTCSSRRRRSRGASEGGGPSRDGTAPRRWSDRALVAAVAAAAAATVIVIGSSFDRTPSQEPGIVRLGGCECFESVPFAIRNWAALVLLYVPPATSATLESVSVKVVGTPTFIGQPMIVDNALKAKFYMEGDLTGATLPREWEDLGYSRSPAIGQHLPHGDLSLLISFTSSRTGLFAGFDAIKLELEANGRVSQYVFHVGAVSCGSTFEGKSAGCSRVALGLYRREAGTWQSL